MGSLISSGVQYALAVFVKGMDGERSSGMGRLTLTSNIDQVVNPLPKLKHTVNVHLSSQFPHESV